ncbi:MAG TPA: leucine--tRNA ligase [Mycobacteriales bacterium]|nr:leucine--tRNA ligase [Mycobacteriales bacterium]
MTETSGVPPYRYTAALAQQIEARWQDRWEREGTFHAPNPAGPLARGFEEAVGRPKFFVNDMFPYPSGEGLHVGHPLGYIGTDVYARYLRMTGHNVLHTIGFDAFGLPAEQYAVETGQHPRVTTEKNVATYRSQLRRLGLGHDPRRAVSTTDAGYYRWTQWIFLKIFSSWYDETAGRARPIAELEAELAEGIRATPDGRSWGELTRAEQRRVIDGYRLAYRHEAPVNWCPGLGTVLANEEVTADGRSDRGNFPVFRRPLTQWMMRITAYADRLIDDLDRLDWPESIKLMQRNWIGRSTGATIRFPAGTAAETAAGTAEIEVFTTRPDTVFGATYLVLAPEHPLVPDLTAPAWPAGVRPQWTNGAATPAEAVAAYQRYAAQRSERDRQAGDKTKTGVFTGSVATNPVNGRPIPIFVADYVLMGYGTGAIMAVPGQDERDWEFAEVFDLPIVRTVQPPDGFDGKWYLGEGPAVNSTAPDGFSLDGLGVTEAKERIIAWLEAHGVGAARTTYKLRDWLFSRQRYWGEPFPIVYDEDGAPRAVLESMLPVKLPEIDDFAPKAYDPDDDRSEPETPLSRTKEWVEVELDLGDGRRTYRRETNTMPQWAGSCWYEIRYTDPTNDERFVDPANERYWMGPTGPGDVGGVDLYVGGVEHAVLHLLYARFWQKVLYDLGEVSAEEPFRTLFNQGYVQAYAYVDERGVYVPAADVVERDGGYFYAGRPVRREYGKMGKSLKNSVTPDEMFTEYGADTLRLYEMFTGPLEQSRPWETKAVVGSYRLLQRIWRNVVDEETGAARVSDVPADNQTRRVLHRTIAAARAGFESLRFNTSIARVTELNNHIVQAWPDGGAPREVVEPLVLLLAPLAPHVAEELWSRLGHAGSLAWTPFPVADPAYLVAETVELPVQVNGKLRSKITVAADAEGAAVEAAARADEKVAAQLDGRTVRRVVLVPGRLVNFVLA